MYFAQDFLPLIGAIGLAVGISVLTVAIRSVTLLGPAPGLLGAVLLAAAVQAATRGAAIRPQPHGLLLTTMALGTLVVAMMLPPQAQRNLTAAVGEAARAEDADA